MEYVAIIILLALAQYTLFTARVGFNRAKLGVDAPKTSGNEAWERLFRVQQNTMEQLLIFIPGMIAFGLYLSPVWAMLPGVVFLLSRQLYSYQYVKKPESRAPGMALSLLSNVVLLVGGLLGVILTLL